MWCLIPVLTKLDVFFSSAVFGENPRYCYSLGVFFVLCRRRCAKTEIFYNIFVITEDIDLKLPVCVHYPMSNPYYQWRQFKMHFSFRIMSLFRLRLFILYQAPQSRALAPACGALVVSSIGRAKLYHSTFILLQSSGEQPYLREGV